MPINPTHQWLLIVYTEAQEAFDNLPSSAKNLILPRLQRLLESSMPYSLPMVEMLKAKKFRRIRKFRAGDYRVLFTLEEQEVIHQKHTYKGTLYVILISNCRDTYED
jgi:mRNA-degrading endonuclease RelE of RelBE toxin-antitoxin system